MSHSTVRHLIPPFLLRYFEAAEDGGQRPASPSLGRARESHDATGINVYRLDQGKLVMQTDPESISTSRARLEDLGVDPTHESLKYLEKNLALLETDALGVIRALVYAVSKSKPNVQLTRRQLNTLYRFLFLMWCRHTSRALQLTSGDLDEKTKDALGVHASRNFGGKPAQPLDVWLQNVRQIVDDKFVDIFTDEKIFLQDRQAFERDCRLGRLALWRSAPDVDFITSLNAFAVYDGWPVDATSGGSAHTSLFSLQHGSRAVFARVKVFPVHPNLALAILDPSMTSGVNPGAHYDTLLSRGSASQFAGFPAFAPDVRYATLSPAARKAQRIGDTKTLETGGKVLGGGAPAGRRIDGRLLETREDDMYTFTPASLSARQTLLVNSLVLHNASDGIVFRSARQLHHALGAYARDFVSWAPKQDYSRLQDMLRRHEMGQPIPDEPVALLALPAPEPPLEALERPTTPSTPGSPFGRKSRRQKRREWMERKRTRESSGLASPPLSSPASSDAELPEDYIGSPLSDPATLVEGSPIMQSIEAAMGSPLIKPLVLDSHSDGEKPRSMEGEEHHETEEHREPEVEEHREQEVEELREDHHDTEKEMHVAAAAEQDTDIVPEILHDAVAAQPPAIQVVEPTPDLEPPSALLGDVFTQEEASALLEEALHLPPSKAVSEAADDEREVALAAIARPQPEEVTSSTVVTEFPDPELEDVSYESDDVLQERIEDVMSYMPPTLDEAEPVVFVEEPEDPFDDSHEAHDEQAGAHALAIDTALHSAARGVPPPLSPLELESLVGNLQEVDDIATATSAGVPVQDTSEDSTPKTSRSASNANGSETGDEEPGQRFMERLLPPPIPDLVDSTAGDVVHSRLAMHELHVTQETPEASEKQGNGVALRKRVGLQSQEKASTTSEKAAPKPPYTLTQKVVGWMVMWLVICFLLVFAFPYIMLQTVLDVFVAREGTDSTVAARVATTSAASPSTDYTDH